MVSTLFLIYFVRPSPGQTIITNGIKIQTLHAEICSNLIFYKRSGTGFLMLCFNNLPNLIVWLHLFLEILSNMCIAIKCFSVWDVINFDIKFSFLMKSFSYIIKKTQYKNSNIFITKRAFKMK